jgi:class 3 adenylate cyclase
MNLFRFKGTNHGSCMSTSPMLFWLIDCYVCATGLPQPQADHFVRMCHFARATVHKVSRLTKALEGHLGPGTGDLGMRVGIHSGSVTAGVLRGQKARFQLFGGTYVVLC